MALNPVMKTLALVAIKEVKAEYESYQRDMDDLRKEGYGRSHCFHGTSLWVEWDPMCYLCEDGATLYDIALLRAYDRFHEIEQMMDAIMKVRLAFGNEQAQPLQSLMMDRLAFYSKK